MRPATYISCTHLINYLFKFPATTEPKFKDKTKSSGFVPEKVQISKPDFSYTYGEKKIEETWFGQMKKTFSNLRLAFHDCKLTSGRLRKLYLTILII